MICVNFDAGYGCFTPEARKSPVKIVVVGMPHCPTYNIFLSYLASRILYRTCKELFAIWEYIYFLIYAGICVALGVLFLLYKVVKKSKGIDKLKKKFFKQDYDLLLQEGLSLAEVDVEEMMSDVEEADPTI
jgi:hypothetical protein